jgi:hypothetical protein
MDKKVKARVIYDRVVVFDRPGGVHYTTFVYKGDMVTVIEGWEYDQRDWKDKQFVKVLCPDGNTGYMNAHSLQEVRN